MWLPVISDSSILGSSRREEAHIEAMIEILPPAATGDIVFAWVRDTPARLSPGQLVLAFRESAAPAHRLAAIIRASDGALVLELYAANVATSLTDEWLEENWGIAHRGLALSFFEKLEVTLSASFLHWCVQKGLVDEAKMIVRLIGRVIFRAAVRAATDRLLSQHPDPASHHARTSAPQPGPITAAEVSATDMDGLIRQLLGLDVPDGDNADRSSA